jgi:hypothetical protein
MFEMALAVGMAFLLGLALGFKLHERIAQPVMADYDRLLRREARDMIRYGSRGAASPAAAP